MFPTGSAAASRIRHMARGLRELGHKVYVIAIPPVKTDEDDPEKANWYNYQGIPYHYAAGWFTPKMRKNHAQKLVKFLAGLRQGLKGSVKQIAWLHEQVGVDVLIGYSKFYFGMHGLVKFCQKKGIVVARDVVEWIGPDSLWGGRINPLFWNAELNFHLSLPHSDGIIAISQFLAKRFSSKGIKVIRVPAIIDPDAFSSDFSNLDTMRSDYFQLTYVGTMCWRDGPMLMLKAVREVLKGSYKIFFNIIGSSGDRGTARQSRNFAQADSVLKSHVKFWGWLSDREMNQRLWHSDALVFTRLAGRPAKAAFPTRLPEYLMSGKPVIASDVSDISEYLTDGKEAIIVKPNSAEALAVGITKLIELPDRGRAIGQAGKKKCYECFNYRTRCKEISNFLEDLVSASR